MPFELISEHLNGIKVIKNIIFPDKRGFFTELYRKDSFEKIGIEEKFVQENLSFSKKDVVRGLHFQWEPPMAKLMRVISGSAFLVAVDIRKGSPSAGKWFGIEVSDEDDIAVWAPAGFARGFYSHRDNTKVQYLCTGQYNNKCESGISWNDPDLNIKWPGLRPQLSEKDSEVMSFSEWMKREESSNFTYKK